jgi:hypothetical protein
MKTNDVFFFLCRFPGRPSKVFLGTKETKSLEIYNSADLYDNHHTNLKDVKVLNILDASVNNVYQLVFLLYTKIILANVFFVAVLLQINCNGYSCD